MKAVKITSLVLLGVMPYAFSGRYELSARMQPAKPAPLGDGSIPIGKVRGFNIQDISVKVVTSTDEYIVFPDSKGTVRVPQNATPGNWRITARGTDAYPIDFRVAVGDDQPFFFDLWLLPDSRKRDVNGVRMRNRANPMSLRVGQWYWFNTSVMGANTYGLWPSFWVDGSSGLLFPGGLFLATKPGATTLHADVLGVHDTVRINVSR